MRDDFVGRDVEVEESGFVWRGPFKDIRLEGDRVLLETEWSAEWQPNEQYALITSGPFGINKIGTVVDWGSWHRSGERIIFSVPMIGRATILSVEEGHLDRDRLVVMFSASATS
jgi:hypothetical protein